MDPIAVLGQPASNFVLPDLTGRMRRLSDFLGHIVVIIFWSAECPWSERVDREMLSLLNAWGENVVFLNIAANPNEPLDLLRQAAKERGLPVVLLDSGQAVVGLYGAQATPHCFVVDTAGVLCYRGAFDDVTFRQRQPTRGYIRDAVNALLAGQVPDPVETPAYGCAIINI